MAMAGDHQSIILYKYCTNIIQISYKKIYKYCTIIIQILCTNYTNTVQQLHKYFINIYFTLQGQSMAMAAGHLSTPLKYFSIQMQNSSHKVQKYFTNAVQILQKQKGPVNTIEILHMHVRYPKSKGPVNVDGSSDWQ